MSLQAYCSSDFVCLGTNKVGLIQDCPLCLLDVMQIQQRFQLTNETMP